ncbi:hypothetical protein Pmani_032733 [Petrolisthes manimaculis]|uniref:Uncharacterized protein n=1 Tax=Petrolisthes manimaculis TaxID=1843537 RepID=A0AAE1NR99_9EUCA|nr:hypothetical protein Pmani_036592 [Petrolisthes manimaculis]KAK4294658.1 hypothetical protein Pmani_032733 [Petrolisthes manimaculis]
MRRSFRDWLIIFGGHRVAKVLKSPGMPDIKRQEMQAGLHKPLSRRQTTEDSEDEVDDERYEQGRIDTKKGVEIDRASAGAVRRSKADRQADTEEEDEFGYTAIFQDSCQLQNKTQILI